MANEINRAVVARTDSPLLRKGQGHGAKARARDPTPITHAVFRRKEGGRGRLNQETNPEVSNQPYRANPQKSTQGPA